MVLWSLGAGGSPFLGHSLGRAHLPPISASYPSVIQKGIDLPYLFGYKTGVSPLQNDYK